MALPNRRGGFFRSLGPDLPPLESGTPGDPGLFGPRSLVWHVGRERILLIGGAAALLLQLAHPLVAAGVADHSGFQDDPLGRLRATLGATLRITFGDSAQALAAASGVGAVHSGVRGALRAGVGPFGMGTEYRAADPALALWVHASLLATSMQVYSRFVRPLSSAERERYYQETKPFARLFGVGDDVLPADEPAFRAYVRQMVGGPQLVVGEDAAALASGVLGPPLPTPARALESVLRTVTAGLLPPRLREAFGLPWGRPQRAGLAALASATRNGLWAVPGRLRFWPHYGIAVERTAKMGNEQGHSSVLH